MTISPQLTQALRSLTVGLAVMLAAAAATAKDPAPATTPSSQADQGEAVDIDQEVRFPQVGPKLKAYITSYMQETAKNLYRDGYDVETMRGGEVVVAVIPTDHLFYPNETSLLPDASKILDRFANYVGDPARFKVLLAAHSDDTGSEEYGYELTERRINALLDYYESRHLPVEDVIGFPMGASDPVTDNDTRLGRAHNRRIEIFLVPNTGLLDEARGKKAK